MNEQIITFPEKLNFLFEPARYKIAYGGRGGSKCLALGTKIIMYDGSLKNVEDVQIDDLLMGPDSCPRKVLRTFRGKSMMYKVSQTSGIDYVVNENHILSLKKSKSCKKDIGKISKAGNAQRPLGRYQSYDDVTNINVVEAYNKSERWKNNFRGYRAGLIEFDEKEIYIDPWFLGAWLGDGNKNEIVIWNEDHEVLDYCYEYANKIGMKVSFNADDNNKKHVLGIRIIRIPEGKYSGRKNLLWQFFIHYNLVNNKHIPFDYLTNSEEIRLQVLAGLIDTDGHMRNNGYCITQVNEQLAKDIKYLADTLGFRTYIRERKTSCQNGYVGKTFSISINGDTWRIPCKIARKIVKKEQVVKNKDFLLSQIKIEAVGYGEYAGFLLNEDSLFLLEDGTVTHNSWSFARALIILAVQKKLKILCGREFQNSISESVHGLLSEQIDSMGLSHEFNITDKTITSIRTGSEFIFMGFKYHITKIKSMEGVDIAWLEEANTISNNSLNVLIPTMRGRSSDDPRGQGGPFNLGPEIWCSFNPDLEDDAVYKRFVLNPPDKFDSKGNRYYVGEKINWSDNPWFPDILKEEMQQLKIKDENAWLHVWEGHTKQTLDGAIFANEIKKVLLENRRGKVPYDSSRPVNTFWDLGHSDHTAIWFIQQVGMEYNIINYYQDSLKKIGFYLEYLQSLNYMYGKHYMPHDADAETLANISIASIARKVYPKSVIIVPRVAKKLIGINAARTVFDLCNFDEENTADGWQCLCRYQYAVNEETGQFSKEPFHNEYSHGADAFLCFAQSLKTETAAKKYNEKTVGVGRSGKVIGMQSRNTWMS